MVKDRQFLAVFNSAHRVMKAESVLKSHCLPVLLIPAPRALSTDCGLALRFDNEQRTAIMKLLAEENLLPEIIYQRINIDSYDIVRSCDETT
jgi:hypothetical protein